VLTDDEIRRVWAACDLERPALAALMKLRLVTAQRGGELAQIRWSDIDGDWLTLRPEITKNKRAHRVYLTPAAIALIDSVPRISETLVFPGRFDTKPLGDEKKAGQRIVMRIEAALREHDPTATFNFRGHDLRRTAATRMAAAGIPQADIAKVLNHAEGGPRATQVYNRYQYDREIQIALETWSRVLTGILDAQPAGDTVVPFARA
jgi:integrase